MEPGKVLHEKDGYHGMYVCGVVGLIREVFGLLCNYLSIA